MRLLRQSQKIFKKNFSRTLQAETNERNKIKKQ